MDIAEVARRSGVPASALRFYEEKGLLTPADRMDGGFALPDDVAEGDWIEVGQRILPTATPDAVDVVVTLNRVGPNGTTELTKKDFESSIERKVDFVIPLDAKVVCQAAKLGKLVAEVGKTSKVGQELQAIGARLLLTADGGDESAEIVGAKGGKSASLADKIGSLRSLLPSKKAEADHLKDIANAH